MDSEESMPLAVSSDHAVCYFHSYLLQEHRYFLVPMLITLEHAGKHDHRWGTSPKLAHKFGGF
jgi:hypothetical protein